jgi:rhomboid family GlyGly-CTERM serine protease
LAEAASRRGALAWAAFAVLLCVAAAIAWPLDREAIDWQPSLAFTQPWRALSAVFVHYSPMHLGANVAGALVVGALGHAAQVPPRSLVAWCAAWPLTQLGLLLQPELLHYGGLSGLLHAGVAVIGVHLLRAGPRRIGVAMLAVLLAKVLSETPWSGALRHPLGWDIAVAPLAHATGALSGALCGLVSLAPRPTCGRAHD